MLESHCCPCTDGRTSSGTRPNARPAVAGSAQSPPGLNRRVGRSRSCSPMVSNCDQAALPRPQQLNSTKPTAEALQGPRQRRQSPSHARLSAVRWFSPAGLSEQTWQSRMGRQSGRPALTWEGLPSPDQIPQNTHPVP